VFCSGQREGGSEQQPARCRQPGGFYPLEEPEACFGLVSDDQVRVVGEEPMGQGQG